MGEALRFRNEVEPPTFEWSGGSLDLSRPRVMGILNVTPDSFSDGGQNMDADTAVRRALAMKKEGRTSSTSGVNPHDRVRHRCPRTRSGAGYLMSCVE